MTSLLALLLLATAGAASLPAEGERVAAVRFEPEEEAPRLGSYLELQPGQPYRAEAVRHAVALMHATGEYEDVVVEAEKGPDGLTLVVRPLRAPLFTTVVREGDPVLDAGDLRRLARLRPREPLWPPRLEAAAREATRALVREGYLEAEVAAAARPGPDGAQAVFTVQAGPRARVEAARLRFEGGPAALPGVLGARLPRVGQVFRREKADEAARAMREQLVRRGYWRAEVKPEEAYDRERARVSLVFVVATGPRMSLEFQGAAPSPALQREIEALLRAGGLEADVREQAAERIEDEFLREGHRGVRVAAREEARPDGQALVYDVTPGPPARVGSVRVAWEDEELPEVALSTRVAAPLDDRVLVADARALQRALEDRGHPEAHVEPEVPEGGGDLPVVFRLRAGRRLTVASVTIQSPVELPREAPSRELSLRPGGPYRVRDLARDRNGLLAAYRDAGHSQVEVTPEVTYSEDGTQARVVLRVAPGPQVRVDHVVIAGLQATQEKVVRRELLVKEGEPLGLERVLESQRRLGALGIFDRVSVREIDPEAPGPRSVVVTAEEAPLTTVAYGIGYAERDQVRGSVEVTRRNLFGLDRSLSTFARYSFRGSRFLITFREPWLLGRRQEFFATVFREEEDRDAFDFVRVGGLVQTVRQRASWSLILRYTYQLLDSFNIVNPDEVGREFTSSTLSGPSTSVVNDTRDDPVDPRRGRFLSADVQLSHAVLGGDSFVKGFLQAAGYHRLTARVVVAVSGRLGLARTFGESPLLLPRPDRFYAGGDYSVRGFALDTVGPLAPSPSGRLVPTGGNALVQGGAELRVDAGRYLSVAAFSDAGNVYPLVSDLDLGEVRYSAGVGLRYRSALGPLRVDWGYKLNRRPGEDPYRFHFTLGHAF